MSSIKKSVAVGILLGVVALVVPARAAPGPSDYGRSFAVPAVPPGRYGVKTPTAAEQFWVTAADGIRTFVEVWLPAPKDGATPPARVPVVAVVTPYAFKGIPRPDRLNAVKRWTEFFVSHGYAMANVHLRGTGESEGCWGTHDTVDADDASRAIELLTSASFSDGNIVLFGKSHDGGAALNVASRGPKQRLGGLKAIVTVSPVTSYTDYTVFDGIPLPVNGADLVALDADSSYTGRSSGATGFAPLPEEFVAGSKKDPTAPVDRTACRAQEALGLLKTDGRVTPWMAERELAMMVSRVTVPTLFTMGLQETQTRQLVGAFDGLRVPKFGVFSASAHDYPDQNSVNAAYSRGDWQAIVLAWMGHWLRGEDNGVEGWPVAQVQDTTGQWRAEPGFPRTGGPAAQLALGPSGTLGVTSPTGATSFNESTDYLNLSQLTNTSFYPREFLTPALKAPLELVGEVFADLWVTVDKPAAHIAAYLLALDADGTVITGGSREGGRSVQFLAPLQEGRFVQTSPVDPPVNTPFRVPLRFEPTDVVVPTGGRLLIGLSGFGPFVAPAAMSGATVTVLHDCEHTSMLRFLLPQEQRDLLDVIEVGEDPAEIGTLGPVPPGLRDGGGLASAPVCGRPVTRDITLHGPAIPVANVVRRTFVLGTKGQRSLPATGSSEGARLEFGLALVAAAAGVRRWLHEGLVPKREAVPAPAD